MQAMQAQGMHGGLRSTSSELSIQTADTVGGKHRKCNLLCMRLCCRSLLMH